MRILLILAAAAAMAWAQSAAGLKWTAPKGWVSKGEAPMRAAQYTVGEAECVVYFFGPSQGGTVDANIARWTSQFASADGKPATAKVTKSTVHSLPVTRMDISGTYTASGGAAMTSQAPKTGSRMLAAIVEGPGGSLFIKFSGPVKAVTAQATAFDAMLASFQQ
jgi:hypothetical protein